MFDTEFNGSHCRICGEEREGGGMCEKCVRKDE